MKFDVLGEDALNTPNWINFKDSIYLTCSYERIGNMKPANWMYNMQ